MNLHAQLLEEIENAGAAPFIGPDKPAQHELISWIGLSLDVDMKSCENDFEVLVKATGEILRGETFEETSQLLEKLVTGIAQTDHYYWHMSVCRLFEGECDPIDGYDLLEGSFLKDPKFFPAAAILAVRSLQIPDQGGYVGGIIGSIAEYNLDIMLKEGIKDTFAFHPESLNEELKTEFINGFWVQFVRSQTPQAWLQSLADNPPRQFGDTKYIKDVVTLLNREFGTEVVKSFLEKSMAVHDPFANQWANPHFAAAFKKANKNDWVQDVIDNAQGKFHLNMGQITPGVFVDVEGALLKNGFLNQAIAQYLNYLLDQNIPVTVFTGGDTEKPTESLAKLGLDDRLLSVHSESDFRGQCLEVVIGGTKPAYQYNQPFVAVTFVAPFNHYEGRRCKVLFEKYGKPRQLNDAAQPVTAGKLDFLPKDSASGEPANSASLP